MRNCGMRMGCRDDHRHVGVDRCADRRGGQGRLFGCDHRRARWNTGDDRIQKRSEEHTSETPVTNAQLVYRLLLENKRSQKIDTDNTTAKTKRTGNTTHNYYVHAVLAIDNNKQ